MDMFWITMFLIFRYDLDRDYDFTRDRMVGMWICRSRAQHVKD